MTGRARTTVAASIGRLRRAAGWTQQEACTRLAKHGVVWSVKIWSLAERSAGSGKTRVFTADEIAALAATFDVTPDVLFGLPGYWPAFDSTGHELWLGTDSEPECVDHAQGDEPGDGWLRLYVRNDLGQAA